jgi:hypothetical protein
MQNLLTINKKLNLIKENATESRELCKDDEDEDYVVKDIEIFKTCFWNEPIPKRKVDLIMQKKLM